MAGASNMSAKNNCSFKTRLGRDAEVRFTQSGKAVMGFAIPIESGWGDSKKVAWCECSLWGKKAEGKLIDHMKKGQEIVILGEIGLETYQGNDGTEKTKMTLNVSDIDLIGGRDSSQQASQGGQQQQRPQQNQGNNPSQNQGGFPTHGGQPQQRQQPQQQGQPSFDTNDPFADNGQPVDEDIPFN